MEELLVYGVPALNARRHKVEIPKPGPNEILVQVEAVGLNPKDFKYTEESSSEDAANTGDDISGVVEGVGEGVVDFRKGDRVIGLHRLGEPHGGYAPYALVPRSTTLHLPSSISFEAGATIPLCAMTAAIAMYQALRLPLPTSAGGDKVPFLICGGATAVGGFALQFAKLSGLNPIITTAGNGIEHVKSLNAATHIIDYRAGNAAYVETEIRKALGGKQLLHAFDCAGLHRSWEAAGNALSPGGRLEMLDWGEVLDWDPVKDVKGPKTWSPPSGVKLEFTLIASAHGEEHDWITPKRAAADADFAFMFYRYISRLLETNRLTPHPHVLVKGGLDGIVAGLADLIAGKVSAKKLVARIADTPGLQVKPLENP